MSNIERSPLRETIVYKYLEKERHDHFQKFKDDESGDLGRELDEWYLKKIDLEKEFMEKIKLLPKERKVIDPVLSDFINKRFKSDVNRNSQINIHNEFVSYESYDQDFISLMIREIGSNDMIDTFNFNADIIPLKYWGEGICIHEDSGGFSYYFDHTKVLEKLSEDKWFHDIDMYYSVRDYLINNKAHDRN